MMPLPAPSGASEPATGAKVRLLFDSWAASADAGRASSATSPSRAMSLRMTILHMGLTGNTSMADARSVHSASDEPNGAQPTKGGVMEERSSEDDLLAAVATGDEAAFGALYDRFARPLYALGLRRLQGGGGAGGWWGGWAGGGPRGGGGRGAPRPGPPVEGMPEPTGHLDVDALAE